MEDSDTSLGSINYSYYTGTANKKQLMILMEMQLLILMLLNPDAIYKIREVIPILWLAYTPKQTVQLNQYLFPVH